MKTLGEGIRRLVVLLALAAVVGCGPAGEGVPGRGAEGNGQLTIKRGGILKYATPGQAKNFNPYLHTASARTSAFDQVYEPLVATKYLPNDNYASDEVIRWDYRQEDATVPWLAERWEMANPTTYIFSIRKGVRWSDGEELTAADVGFTWDYLKNNKFPRDSAKAALIESYELVDRHTIRATLSKPDPLFLRNWREESYVVPKHVADRGDAFEKVAIGTGPFIIKELSDIGGVSHIRNDSYWDQPRPHPDGMRVFYGLDRSAMVSAFITGQLDLVKPDDYGSQVMLEQSAPNALSDTYLANHNRSFLFNMKRTPFNDLRVRRALNMAVDRQALITQVNQGKMGMPNPPGTGAWATRWALPQEELLKLPGYNPGTRERDLAEAKRLLAEAGYPNGFKTRLMYDQQSTSGAQITEIGANQLRVIGVQVDLEPLERGVFNKREVEGDYELMQTNLGDGTENPYRTYHERFHSKGTFSSKVGVGDAELDRLIHGLASFRTEEERTEIQQAVQRRILEQTYTIPLIDVLVVSWWQPWVHGYINERAQQVKPRLQPATIWLDVDAMPEGRRSERVP